GQTIGQLLALGPAEDATAAAGQAAAGIAPSLPAVEAVAVGAAGTAAQAGPAAPEPPATTLTGLAGLLAASAPSGTAEAAQDVAGGPLAALIANLAAPGGSGPAGSQGPAESVADLAGGSALPAAETGSPAAMARGAGEELERTSGAEAIGQQAVSGLASAGLPIGIFGPLAGQDVAGAQGERVAGPPAGAHVPGTGLDRAAPGDGDIGDDEALPAGRDQRRRHQEREFVRAVQRRMLEERERMGGLGGLIR
ncbi:MAG TPA: hypothetical protein VF323_06235, partial [Candidatus Limnocylindrales bacterium]